MLTLSRRAAAVNMFKRPYYIALGIVVVLTLVVLKLPARTTSQLKLAISADTKAPFGQIVKVMDVAKELKIKSVNAFTREAAKP